MSDELEKRPTIVHVEAELTKRPTAPQVEAEIQKCMGIIKMLIEKLNGPGEKDGEFTFHSKAASDNKPTPWSGKKDKIEFPEFPNAVKNRAEALHEDGAAMMEHYEIWKQAVTPADLDTNTFPDIKKFSKILYLLLFCSLTGEPQSFVKNAKRGTGLSVWRDIVQSYDPQTQVDKSAAPRTPKFQTPPKGLRGFWK